MRVPSAPPWGPREREVFRAAVRSASQTQTQCAAELVQFHGAERASQADVSRWISGKIETPECVEAIASYCSAHGSPAGDVEPTDRPPPEESLGGAGDGAPATDADADQLRTKVSELTADLETAQLVIDHWRAIDRLHTEVGALTQEIDRRQTLIQEHRAAIDQLSG